MKVYKFIDTGIFPATVLFVCGYNHDGIMKMMTSYKKNDPWREGIRHEKTLIDNKDYWGHGMRRTIETIKTGKKTQVFYIIIREFNFKDEEYIRLAHEILHICQFFLPDVLERDREFECEAYLHSHLMRQCLEALRYEKKI